MDSGGSYRRIEKVVVMTAVEAIAVVFGLICVWLDSSF